MHDTDGHFNPSSTLPETNSSPLKINGWKMSFLLGRRIFRGKLAVCFREGTILRQVRYNTELEQAQRVLSARVEEASLQARHAALEADMSRRWVGSCWVGLCQECWLNIVWES